MIPSGPSEHLFVVALGPVVLEEYGSKAQIIAVNFTSIKEGLKYDDACIVRAGEHPFIIRDSYVYYRGAQLLSASSIENKVSSNEWRAQEPCSEVLLQRVLKGFRNSKRLPRHFNHILDALDI